MSMESRWSNPGDYEQTDLDDTNVWSDHIFTFISTLPYGAPSLVTYDRDGGKNLTFLFFVVYPN